MRTASGLRRLLRWTPEGRHYSGVDGVGARAVILGGDRAIHRFSGLIRKLPMAAGVAAHEPGVTAGPLPANSSSLWPATKPLLEPFLQAYSTSVFPVSGASPFPVFDASGCRINHLWYTARLITPRCHPNPDQSAS